MNIVFVIAALFVAQAPVRIERPPLRAGTATIQGRVLDSTTERPVEGVDVNLMEAYPAKASPPAGSPRQIRGATVKTNASGEFVFKGIGAGSYALLTQSKTHQVACLGSTRESAGPCWPFEIADGEERLDADIFARPAAMIRGRIFDHEGNPVTSASVRVNAAASERMLGGANPDADGRFEIGGLAPGAITLLVDVHGRRGEGMTRAYYPGVLEQRDAQPVDVEVARPTDIELRIPKVGIGSLNAVVTGPPDFQLDKLVLIQPESKSLLHLSRQDDVTASVINLREGRYFLEARATAKGKPLAAFARVEIGDSELNVSIDLQESGTVTGRIVAERGGLPPINGAHVAATWLFDGIAVDPSGPEHVPISADGSFFFSPLLGSYTFKVTGLTAGWEVISIRAGRTDITSSVFEITSGSKTELTITVARR